MAEDNFDHSEEDFASAKGPPRVNLSYANETAANQKTLSRRLLPKMNVTRDGLTLTVKILLVIALILAYPVMTVMSHKLDDSPVQFDDSRFWAVPDIGVSSVLIARELDGPGWVTDRHRWHPQARLRALPAWQKGLQSALADHGRLIISQLGNQKDQDLIAAIRLLDPSPDQDMTARLTAASEALSRYDDRVAGEVTAAPRGQGALVAKLKLTSMWVDQKHVALAAVASPGDGWIASTQAIEAVYSAKAAAHVAHEILSATATQEKALLAKYEAEAAMQDVLNTWRRAAALRPLFIANQSSDAVSGLNHPAIMAFRMSEARNASEKLAALLQAPAPQSATPAPVTGQEPPPN